MCAPVNIKSFLREFLEGSLQQPPKPHSFVSLPLQSSFEGIFIWVCSFLKQYKEIIIFSFFVIITMYFISIPYKLGLYFSIFLVTLYKLLCKKVIHHLKSGKLEFNIKDYTIYLLMVIMTLFTVFIGTILDSQLPYFVEAFIGIAWAGNFQILQGFTLSNISKLPDNISKLFFFSDTSSSVGGNNSGSGSEQASLSSDRTISSPISAETAERNAITRRLFAVNPSNSYTDIPVTCTPEERAELERSFKTQLMHYLPATGHYHVDTSRPLGMLDNNEALASKYSNHRKFDEYYFMKISFIERYKEGMCSEDQVR